MQPVNANQLLQRRVKIVPIFVPKGGTEHIKPGQMFISCHNLQPTQALQRLQYGETSQASNQIQQTPIQYIQVHPNHALPVQLSSHVLDATTSQTFHGTPTVTLPVGENVPNSQ